MNQTAADVLFDYLLVSKMNPNVKVKDLERYPLKQLYDIAIAALPEKVQKGTELNTWNEGFNNAVDQSREALAKVFGVEK